ncbi:FMN-binding protein [Naasia aerilata]|uniref:FMN-binding domain-containing protein n=1 Tax=Naasia aerilata TaxID=1162966 RepID=A0ABN6XKW0_9MICO|nr:FMN-binding protein [Naasia aerilata]BDZ44295.1 hypothetical protein GCM10025866_02040 [Naasia aerilata]
MTDRSMPRTLRSSRTALVSLAGVGLLGTLAGCAGGAEAEESGTGSSTGADSAGARSYADGTYEADGSYRSPGGQQTVTVSITLADDTVTAVTVTPHATDPNAKQFQGQFAGAIADQVVGRDIDSLNVSRVAGSSLTSSGFNDAVEQIKADAAE